VRRALALAVLALAGCGGGDEPPTVYAASSLREVLPEVLPGARLDLAGSGALRLRIERGAPADAFAAASTKDPEALAAAGRCAEPVVFATNELVLVVPAEGTRVRTLDDLQGKRVALGSEGVPAGDYAREALRRLGGLTLDSSTVSLERDVASITAKVALGSADAGFAYRTDVAAADGRLRAIALPEAAQPVIAYAACAVTEAGEDVVDRLTGDDARAALRDAGFGLP
jgi:molybdate transport system substrate-binding protein